MLAFNCCRPNQVDELEKELGVRLVISADGTSVKVFSTSEREQLLQYFWQLVAHYLVQELRANSIPATAKSMAGYQVLLLALVKSWVQMLHGVRYVIRFPLDGQQRV